MLEHPAKILHIGCGTKTGKSMGLYLWLIEGLLKGEACAFIGPWFFRSRAAFDQIKDLLAPFIRGRQCTVNEARLQIRSSAGGFLDFLSGDNPDAVFGGNYFRVVIDEASRQPREVVTAALTTITATGGKLRLAFNLELGVKNHAIAALIRVQKMSPEERAKSGEDFLTFPTGGDGLVDPEVIEAMRGQMPEALFKALYLGIIPESDTSLFRNLDKIFTGRERVSPEEGKKYFLGLDLGRKSDWTVAVVVSEDGEIVAGERFHELSWGLQVSRCARLYQEFKCQKAIYDQTGIGDVIGEELEAAGMVAEGFMFTQVSRRALIEELVVACDSQEIKVPATEKFKIFRAELESMEYTLDGNSVKYTVPSGCHDDCIFGLALATHAFRQAKGSVLGWLDWLKRKAKEIASGVADQFGVRKDKPAESIPAPVAVVVKKDVALVCPKCGNGAVAQAAKGYRCNQCGCCFDKDYVIEPDVVRPGFNCCAAPLLQTVSGIVRCANCAAQTAVNPIAAGHLPNRKNLSQFRH